MRKTLPNAGVLSLDARGHGETVVEHLDSQSNNADLDLSLETLSQDLLDVIHMTQTQLVWPELPRLVLIGHSLGGAVVTNVAVAGKLGNAVLGYAVLDVVEGILSENAVSHLTLLFDLLSLQDLRLMHCKACTPISPPGPSPFHPSLRELNGSESFSESMVVSCQHYSSDLNKYTLSHNPQQHICTHLCSVSSPS